MPPRRLKPKPLDEPEDLEGKIDAGINALLQGDGELDRVKMAKIKLAMEWVKIKHAIKEGDDGSFFGNGGGGDPAPAANGSHPAEADNPDDE